MFPLSENARRIYLWLKDKNTTQAEIDGKKLRVTLSPQFELISRGGFRALLARAAIAELVKTGLLIPIEGQLARAIIIKAKGSWATRNQKVYQIEIVSEQEITLSY